MEKWVWVQWVWMDHVHFLNYRSSCKKAGKVAIAAKVKAQALEWQWEIFFFAWPLLGILLSTVWHTWLTFRRQCQKSESNMVVRNLQMDQAAGEAEMWFKRLKALDKVGFMWLTHLHCCMENWGKTFGLEKWDDGTCFKKEAATQQPSTYYSMIVSLSSCVWYNRSMNYLG